MFDLDTFEVVPSTRSLVITLEISPDELEFALATDGRSLREQTMLAIVAKLIQPDEAAPWG